MLADNLNLYDIFYPYYEKNSFVFQFLAAKHLTLLLYLT